MAVAVGNCNLLFQQEHSRCATGACLAPCPKAPDLAVRNARAKSRSIARCRRLRMKHKAGNTRLAAGLSMTNGATCTADRSTTHTAFCPAHSQSSSHVRPTLRNVASSADTSTGSTIALRMSGLTSTPCNCLANLLALCKTSTSKGRCLALLSIPMTLN